MIVNPDGSRQPMEGSIAVGAVIAKAIYDVVGARLRQLPMTPARILAALRRG